jgi:hypothetical protein
LPVLADDCQLLSLPRFKYFIDVKLGTKHRDNF